MIRLRTKLLLCGATLAPAAIVLFRMDVQEAIWEAKAMGALAVFGVEPGYYIVGMLWVGLICFLGFVVSLIIDLRRAK
ncbi:MAG: hypothetical protein ABSB82_11280 [Terriglobia bacterium]